MCWYKFASSSFRHVSTLLLCSISLGFGHGAWRRCPGHPSRWDGTNRSPERPVRRSWSCSRGMGSFLAALGAQWCPVDVTQGWSFEPPELGFQHGFNFNRKQLEWLTSVYIDIYFAWWFVFLFSSYFSIYIGNFIIPTDYWNHHPVMTVEKLTIPMHPQDSHSWRVPYSSSTYDFALHHTTGKLSKHNYRLIIAFCKRLEWIFIYIYICNIQVRCVHQPTLHITGEHQAAFSGWIWLVDQEWRCRRSATFLRRWWRVV